LISGITSPTPSPTPSSKKDIYTPDFEEFWRKYPNHASGKKDAFQSWQKKVGENKALIEKVMASIEEHRQRSKAWKDGFIPHATTWLNKARWTAEFGPMTKDQEAEEALAKFKDRRK